MDLGLDGRRALVTGGTAGIGLETARRLAHAGASVAVVGRDARRASATADELRAVGAPVALGLAHDVASARAVEAAVATAAEELGGLDVLVNNVGVARQASFADVTDEEWRASFEVNLLSHVRAMRAALPHLRASDQARIVNVSSTSGKRPSTGMPDYSVMKAALLSLSRLVADLYAGEGIRCNAVTPGPTATDAWLGEGGLADQQGDREEVLAKVGAGRPLGRLAEPEEIAAVTAFLASERASYVTGAAWSADGGTVPIIV